MAFRGVDYLLIDSQLSHQELLVRQTARRFVDERVLPLLRDCFRDARFPSELIPEIGELGFLGANLHGYGCAGMSNVEYGLVMQEVERADSGLRSFISVQGALVMYPILEYGSEEQKLRWLPLLQSGEAIGCFGLTEPDFGSNPAGMRTRAEKDGETWILNGEKTWITNGTVADVAIVWARTGEGIRGFLVEKGTPGFTTSDIHGKWSMRASVTSSLSFADCRVPGDAMLPGARGLKGPLGCLSQARYGNGPLLHHPTKTVRRQTDRQPSTGAGEAGRHDHGDHQSPASGAALRTPQRHGKTGARAHLDAEAEQRRNRSGLRAHQPRFAGR
jgi:glutaryl-CoA dehydrogenase